MPTRTTTNTKKDSANSIFWRGILLGMLSEMPGQGVPLRELVERVLMHPDSLHHVLQDTLAIVRRQLELLADEGVVEEHEAEAYRLRAKRPSTSSKASE